MDKVKLVEGKSKKFHYVVVGRNGEPRSTSEQYASKSNAKRAAKKAAKDSGAEFVDTQPVRDPVRTPYLHQTQVPDYGREPSA